MSAYMDWNEFSAKMDTFVTFTVFEDDQLFVVLVCQECDHFVAKVTNGDAILGTLVRVAKDHDCEDELADVVYISPDDEDNDDPILRDEDYDHIGPVQDLSTIPQVTEVLMAGLYAEVEFTLKAAAGVRGDEAA